MNGKTNVDEEMTEQKGNDACESQSPSPPETEIEKQKEKESEEIVKIVENEEIDSTSTSDDAILKGTALLKSLLSTSTASLVPVVEKMITTTEVTDETLNLKKILYQPDKEKGEEKESETPAQNGQQISISELPIDEDDRRLVIDISDEEKDGTSDEKNNEKLIPSLNISREDENRSLRRMMRPTTLDTSQFPIRTMTRNTGRVQNSLPQSFTYNLEPSATTGITNSVKIDILANSSTEMPSSSDKSSKSIYQASSKCATTMTTLDELNVIGHEIDKQITKKTNEALVLLTDFLSGSLDKNLFLAKMSDATDTNLHDLLSISKKLVKRFKFEVNPNLKDFMKIKHLQFPTASKDLVIYFDNLLPSLNKEKFQSMIKFYEIIIKEMLNLNKTKILQYIVDFMVIRKNAQLDLLNYNFQLTSAPNLKQKNAAVTKFQLPDSTQNPSERRPMRLNDTSYNFIIRSDPIYLQAGSSFVTNHRDIITCRMSPRIQTRSFERKPFDNNMLKGRRIGRRLVVTSPEGEKVQAEFLRTRFPLTPQSEPGTPVQNLVQLRSSTPIVVESDTPPPSIPSEPPSPPQHKIIKAHIISNTLIKPSRLDRPNEDEATVKTHETDADKMSGISDSRQAVKRRAIEYMKEKISADPLRNGQITMQEIQTLSQNGTEIIPTSILKNTMINRNLSLENEQRVTSKSSEKELQMVKRILPRGSSFEEQVKPSQPMVPKIPRRRQSCHERIMIPASKEKDDRPEPSLEDSVIGKNYMKFLHDFEIAERKKKQIEMQQRPTLQIQQPLHNQAKRVRFSADTDTSQNPRNLQPPQIHYPIPQQLTQQQHQQHQQQLMENRQRLAQFQASQRSPLRSPVKSHPPTINYKYYQHQFERELRERGFDHRIENPQEPNRPLELVSHIPPERYHQVEQQRAHYANQNVTKPIRVVQEKNQQQQQQQQQQQRIQPRNMQQMNLEAQQAAMMAAAYHQLQSMHRDPSTLTPQQYAEHLKQLDHLKQFAPSAFSAYQRSPRQMEDQRMPPDYYNNTQDIHHIQGTRSPPLYQISSSSSRENSPNYDMLHKEPSLQRKLKYKAKSSKYVEPNQLAKPFYNPAHSTYFDAPFALTKNKPATPTSPMASLTAFRPPERQRSRSPVQIPRSIIENAANSQHYQWMMVHAQAQAQAQAQSQAAAHAQNLALQNQPQRPMPRPPVPSFLEQTKVNGSSAQPGHFQEQQPTPFLRSFYANQKNY